MAPMNQLCTRRECIVRDCEGSARKKSAVSLAPHALASVVRASHRWLPRKNLLRLPEPKCCLAALSWRLQCRRMIERTRHPCRPVGVSGGTRSRRSRVSPIADARSSLTLHRAAKARLLHLYKGFQKLNHPELIVISTTLPSRSNYRWVPTISFGTTYPLQHRIDYLEKLDHPTNTLYRLLRRSWRATTKM